MEAGHFQIRKPLNRVRTRLTVLRPLLLSGNPAKVLATAWPDPMTGESK